MFKIIAKLLLLAIPVLVLSCSGRLSGTRAPKGGESMLMTMTTREVRHITVSINRPPDEVYAFVTNYENLPKWATGLGGSIRNKAGEWIADSPMGEIKIKFAEKNGFGVLDHEVTLPSGVKINNPMRVIPNGEGSEVFFTLIRQPEVTDEKFASDAKWVEKDLNILKGILEGKAKKD